jgi:predicted transposase/invertase (TIGR01784 family)
MLVAGVVTTYTLDYGNNRQILLEQGGAFTPIVQNGYNPLMTISTAHDHFFRKSFGRVEIARNYLEEYLPAEVMALLDLDTLSLEEDTFIDEEMQKHQADLLYQVRLHNGQIAYVYFLFEHKSYPDRLVALQLLRYMVRFWEQQVSAGQFPLPPIMPLVIYHGERTWPYPTTFEALVEMPAALRPYLPHFNYYLSDFSHLSDETIRGEVWLRVSLAVLRSISRPDLQQELDGLIDLIFQLRKQQTGLEYIRTILYYLSEATERVSREDLQKALLRQGTQGENVMATIAQEFIQQGIEQGIEQGVEQGLEKSVRRVLQRRFGDMPEGINKQLASLTVSELEEMLDTAVLAPDLDTFAEALTAVYESK